MHSRSYSGVALALGTIGAPAIPMLSEVMKKGSRVSRLLCLDALGGILDDRVTAILMEVTDTTDEQIARKAEEILCRREGLKVWKGSLEEDQLASALSSAMADNNFRQERKAFEQVGSQETERITDILCEENRKTRLKTILKYLIEERPIIEGLFMILKTEDEEIKRRVVDVLDQVNDISPRPFMIALLDRDPFIRSVAARNLGRLGCLDAVHPLSVPAMMRTNTSAVRQ